MSVASARRNSTASRSPTGTRPGIAWPCSTTSSIEQAVLGGMSQGGFLSLRAALLAPERVRALVLIDTQSGVEDPERLPAYRQMQQTWLAAGPIDELTRDGRQPDHRRSGPERSLDREVEGASARGPGTRPATACSIETTSRTAWARSRARRSCSTAPPMQSIEIEKGEELCQALSGCPGPRARRGRHPRLQPHQSRRRQRAAARVPAVPLSSHR